MLSPGTAVPDPLLIYIPGKDRHDDSAILMELELGGDRWEPQLKREARRVLKKRFGDGQIDQMLGSPSITYDDIVGLLDSEAPRGSLLKVIFSDAGDNNAFTLADWLAHDIHDQEIVDKGVQEELYQLIDSRLGLRHSESRSLADARRRTVRYVLIAEFRNDLDGELPGALEMVGRPAKKAQLQLALDVAHALRERHAPAYRQHADAIEQELHLATLGFDPSRLGSIDTFRFEERALLEYSGRLIVEGKFDEARSVIELRRRSFWAQSPMRRQEQWQVFELAAQLGSVAAAITLDLPNAKQAAGDWVARYTADNGWYRADLLHRRLESTLAAMTDPVESEKVIHRVRSDYDQLIDRMTRGFVQALAASDWVIPGHLHQTQVYETEVHNPSEKVCFLLIDALRYEMGVELKGLLEGAEDLGLESAVAALPTITPVGMAALMPGAEQSFSVVDKQGSLAARIEDSTLCNLNDRRKAWKGKVPNIVDLELDKVLSQSSARLENKIADAPLVIVRSLDIDSMGEGGNTFLARQVLDTAISNVARAIKRLANMGISKFVVAADHGHLFVQERDESQRIDKPGGDEVCLHRRCWVGRGGSTPPGTVRATAEQLGYAGDLDFVFPSSIAVFKSGGDLAYYHGGLSLQELLVPVLTVRMPTTRVAPAADVAITLKRLPKQIANRIVTFGFAVEHDMFDADDVVVRPVLLSDGQHVGHVGMALDAEFDPLTHCVTIKPGDACTVGIQLLRDDVKSVEIVILEPETDRVLAKSDSIPVQLGIRSEKT